MVLAGTYEHPCRPTAVHSISRQRLMQLTPLLILTPLTSSLLARASDWPRNRPRCCCCCRHAAVGTPYDRRQNGRMRQTHQTVNDVLDVRITFVRFFQTDLICALDNGLCVVKLTPGYPMQRRCRCAEVSSLTLPQSSPTRRCELRHRLLYFLEDCYVKMWCCVVKSLDVQCPPMLPGLAMSGLAISAPQLVYLLASHVTVSFLACDSFLMRHLARHQPRSYEFRRRVMAYTRCP